MKAVLRRVRIAPKKVQIVAGLIKNTQVQKALDLLKFTPKKAAKILSKVVKSAEANATNNFKQKKEKLFIQEILVSPGPTLKRHMPISRGRSHPILKRTSHISIQLTVKEQ